MDAAPKKLLVVFALSVFLPAVALAVLAYGSVARERRALTAERAGALTATGARIRRGLSSALEELRRTEEERPWFHYNALYFEPDQIGKGLSYQLSPLADGNAHPLVETWSHFQIDPAGSVSSPTPPRQSIAQTAQIRRNEPVDEAASPRPPADAQKDALARSARNVEQVQEKVLPRVRTAQQLVVQDGKGRFPEEFARNFRQWTNRKGAVANQQSEESVRDIIEGKKQTFENDLPEEEILSVEVSSLRFEELPDFGIYAYRYVDAPNETGGYGGQPVLRFVQGFRLDLDHIRGTLFPALVAADLDPAGAKVSLVPALESVPAGVAWEEPVPQLPGYRIVVEDTEPGWVGERVARLSFLLIGIAALLLLVIAGGLSFTLRAVRQEVRLARRKSDFVAAVTHELRTPLTGIKMYADMLKAGWVKDEETRDDYVGFMAAETDRLARLVNRVLDFARTERGETAVGLVDLAEPILEVERDFGPWMREKGFTLEVDLATKRPAVANADAVKQILLNLLENAVKYAPDATDRTIRVAVRDAADGIDISVIDRGPGVPEEERERIFAEFYRPGEELTREAPGAGLGLALVRRLAESMGGSVEVGDTPGGGATFRVHLQIGV
ncbi:MAG: HAMP domain-containing sensor histidine kinase [Planctomycetota bacterium]